MKSSMRSSIVLGIMVLSTLSAVALAADKGKGDNPLGKVYHSAVNIWYENPSEIYITNYHKGTIIPINTKVTITKYSSKEVTFKTESNVEYTLVYVPRHSIKPMSDLFNQYFSEKEIAWASLTAKNGRTSKPVLLPRGCAKKRCLLLMVIRLLTQRHRPISTNGNTGKIGSAIFW